MNNLDTIIEVTKNIALMIIGLKGVKTAIEIATVAQRIFNLVVRANPYVFAAIALGTLVAAAFAFNKETDQTIENHRKLQREIDQTNYDQKNLADTYKESAWAAERYGIETDDLREANEILAQSIDSTAGEINRFNNLRLDGAIASMNAYKAATSLAERQAQSFADSYAYLESIGAVTARTAASTASGATATGGAAESAFDKVRKFIKDAQKDLRKAQETYNETVRSAREDYAKNVIKTEQEFADRLAGIVQQSQNRLRTAFADVVRVSLTDIFTVEETQSVENLVKGLQERLGKSRALLERAGELNAAGFSQTFIEQVVQAGVDTGNELAQAILDATPDTQRELQGLFTEVERTAETGMDSLAREIYDKAGLATRELRTLYENTQQELTDTLLQLKLDLDNDIIDANAAFVDSIGEIRDRLRENIAGMKGDLGGLEGTLEQFYGKLDKLEGGAKEDIASVGKTTESAGQVAESTSDLITVAASAIQGATGILIDSASDVGAVYSYLGERIAAAERFASNIGDPAQAQSALAIAQDFRTQQAMLRGGVTTGTVININVKTDSTQSVAMVGKTLGNTINKYVTAGGQVLVSPT